MTTYNYTYDPDTMWDNFGRARFAVRVVHANLRRKWSLSNDPVECRRLEDEYDARKWIVREIERYPLHSVIEAAIKLSRPHDWHQLFLEWPHISQGDRTKIAYTQNEDKGQRDIQTVTSVGKYLRRHFPDLSDHEIRDLVARHGSADTYKFVHTTAEMIYHLHRGPGSCMVWGENRSVRCHDGVNRHPYEVYDPKYGWHMAVRISGDDTVGRALCMTKPDGHKYFVRTYAKPANEGSYSQADNGMENWLTEQGYSKHSSWDDGERLAYHPAGDHFLAPYLDGSDKTVCVDEDERVVVIDDDGIYACDQTGGVPTCMDEDRFECSDCGDMTDENDGYWVGYHEDEHVCEGCYENNYVCGYGRNGRNYNFSNDDAVYVDSQQEYYHCNYLDDNNIVELDNGDYEHIDSAIEVNGEWYHIDDDRICRTEDTDEYLLCDEGCWQCEESGNWYSDSIDYVEVDGCKYHPDNAPATDDEDDSDGDTAVAVKPAPTTLVVESVTMQMMNEVALVEDRDFLSGYVRFSMTILHNGTRYTAHRTYSEESIQDHGADWMRQHLRRVLSDEIVQLSLDATTTTI